MAEQDPQASQDRPQRRDIEARLFALLADMAPAAPTAEIERTFFMDPGAALDLVDNHRWACAQWRGRVWNLEAVAEAGGRVPAPLVEAHLLARELYASKTDFARATEAAFGLGAPQVLLERLARAFPYRAAAIVDKMADDAAEWQRVMDWREWEPDPRIARFQVFAARRGEQAVRLRGPRRRGAGRPGARRVTASRDGPDDDPHDPHEHDVDQLGACRATRRGGVA